MAVRDDVVATYRRALEAEIDLVAGLIKRPPTIARLHWGGGTPSILGVDGLRSVVSALRNRFLFEAGFEHAIELDPRHVTGELVDGLAALGVNRASLGVQDLNPMVQLAIGRLQPPAMIETAAARLRISGINSLSFDLMYGLPLQSVESVRKTCASVVALSPDRIACFGYAHLPRMRSNQKQIDETKLPSSDERIEQAETIADQLTQSGYVKIGIDHFAKPSDALAQAASRGTLHRNFQGYTVDDCRVLLGLGASSISTFAEGFVQNIADVPRYVRTIEAGSLASARGCRIDPEDRRRGKIIERLMCDFEVDLESIAPGFGFTDELSKLRPLQDEGLITIDRSRLVVTEAGRPVVRVVASTFDRFRQAQRIQFSTAV
jgi:oxygen-independent coproporphyrinogen III oxidase